MKAMTVSETADKGLLRMVVDKTDEAIKLLKKQNYLVVVEDVLAVEIPERPGGLYDIAEILGEHDINIEYIYSSTLVKAESLIVLKVDKIEKAIEVFKRKKIKMLQE